MNQRTDYWLLSKTRRQGLISWKGAMFGLGTPIMGLESIGDLIEGFARMRKGLSFQMRNTIGFGRDERREASSNDPAAKTVWDFSSQITRATLRKLSLEFTSIFFVKVETSESLWVLNWWPRSLLLTPRFIVIKLTVNDNRQAAILILDWLQAAI